MSRVRGGFVLLGIALCATPVMAQQRGVVFRAMGGGYSHTENLNTSGPDAHFKLGYTLTAGIGVQFNKYLALESDFTFGQTRGLGAVDFVGERVNRYYVGGRLNLRYPLSGGFAPFVFGGAGAVRVDQQGIQTMEDFQHFTRFAGLFGAGVGYDIPKTRVAILAEGKALTYKWIAAPFNRQQLDLTYTVGIAYRIGF
jgi:opacity protein-like surface antigen